MFREGCEDAAGASRAKNVASSKNPVRLTPRHSRVIASTAFSYAELYLLVSLSMPPILGLTEDQGLADPFGVI